MAAKRSIITPHGTLPSRAFGAQKHRDGPRRRRLPLAAATARGEHSEAGVGRSRKGYRALHDAVPFHLDRPLLHPASRGGWPHGEASGAQTVPVVAFPAEAAHTHPGVSNLRVSARGTGKSEVPSRAVSAPVPRRVAASEVGSSHGGSAAHAHDGIEGIERIVASSHDEDTRDARGVGGFGVGTSFNASAAMAAATRGHAPGDAFVHVRTRTAPRLSVQHPTGAVRDDAADGEGALLANEVEMDRVLSALVVAYPEATAVSLDGCSLLTTAGLRTLTLELGRQLEVISLSNSTVSDVAVKAFAIGLHRLHTVVMNDCLHITDKAVKTLAKACAMTLRSLSLSGCPGVTSDGIAWLGGGIGPAAPACANLCTLNVANCAAVTGRALHGLAVGCHKLQFVNLNGCRQVTADGIVALAQSNPDLRVLDCGGDGLINDSCLVALGETCHQLCVLDVTSAAHITDVGVTALAHGCPQLRKLLVGGCYELTAAAVLVVASCSQKLELLDMTGCERVPQSALVAAGRGLRYCLTAQSFFGLTPHPAAATLHAEERDATRAASAAATLQAAVRCWLAMRRYRRWLLLLVRGNGPSSRPALVALQRSLRNRHRRRHEQLERERHTTVAGDSAAVARDSHGVAGDHPTEQQLAWQRSTAATRIQAAFRGWMCRYRTHVYVRRIVSTQLLRVHWRILDAAALQVQRVARGAVGRRIVRTVFQERIDAARRDHDATRLIQRAVRYAARRRKARRVRLNWIRRRREWKLRRWLSSMWLPRRMRVVAACVAVQRHVRRVWAWRRGLVERARMLRWWLERASAIRIQKMVRGHRVRHMFVALVRLFHGSATDIQRVFRGSRVIKARRVLRAAAAKYRHSAAVKEASASRAGVRAHIRRKQQRNDRDSASSSEDSDDNAPWKRRVAATEDVARAERRRRRLSSEWIAAMERYSAQGERWRAQHREALRPHEANQATQRLRPRTREGSTVASRRLRLRDGLSAIDDDVVARAVVLSSWEVQQRGRTPSLLSSEASASPTDSQKVKLAAGRRMSSARRAWLEAANADAAASKVLLKFNTQLVGYRVRVYWDQENTWYPVSDAAVGFTAIDSSGLTCVLLAIRAAGTHYQIQGQRPGAQALAGRA